MPPCYNVTAALQKCKCTRPASTATGSKLALAALQPSILKGVRVGDVEGSVAAVRRFVTASTDRIDIALDEHWASAHKARVVRS